MKTKYTPPQDRFCPICFEGNNKSGNVKVCWECQKELVSDYCYDDYDNPKIYDYSGIIDFGNQLY